MIYRWDEESHQTSKCSDCDVTNQHCTFRNCDAYADCHTSNCMKTDYMTCKGDDYGSVVVMLVISIASIVTMLRMFVA